MRTGCLSNTDPLAFGVEFAYWPPLKTWKKREEKKKEGGRIDNGEVKERKGKRKRKGKGKKW